ncbi:MAG: alanine dehydrogenase [bacterium]|jgi:alanine dehydrogenase|nr:alanine dehydrogenase [bacterium]
MQFSLAKEVRRGEHRVALTPSGVGQLIAAGQEVFVQSGAGTASHFTDQEYQDVGGTIVYTPEEAYARGEVVVKVLPPKEEETELIREDCCLVSFLQIAAGRDRLLDTLLKERILALGLELVSHQDGRKPLVTAMSEIAGQLAIQFGANYLLSDHGGRGILLGSIPGISGATVTILGAGTLGTMAARTALGMGAQVVLLDRDISQLRRAEHSLGHVATMMATSNNIRRALAFADIAIGAVSLPGDRTPHLVDREMVRGMKAGSVIVDTSVDMGGCFETSRPTTIESPTFIAEDVVHCCIPNLPSLVCRTSSRALSHSIAPLLLEMAREGGAIPLLRRIQGLRDGVVTIGGQVTNARVAELYGRPLGDLMAALAALSDKEGGR